MNAKPTGAREEVERWIREVYLPKEYGQSFTSRNLPLQSRGEAKFHAVSDDGEIVAMICATRAYVSSGKVDKDALLKVQSDALKILWLDAIPAKRMILCTDPDMVRVIKEEKRKSHFPKEIQVVRVKLPKAIEESFSAQSSGPDSPEMSTEREM